MYYLNQMSTRLFNANNGDSNGTTSSNLLHPRQQ